MSMKFNVPDDDAQEQPSLEKLLESTMQWAATQIADDFKKIGCEDLNLTVYPDAGHDSWTEAYGNPELYEWFLKHARE